VGQTLKEIGIELAKLPAHHAPTRRDWSRRSRQWSARIDERIAELHRLKPGLTECIGYGCLSLDRCRLANPNDRAAARGPARATGSPTARPAADRAAVASSMAFAADPPVRIAGLPVR